jgi:CRP/FNR family transcriptional regulator, cyclic AMP receptor protein
MGGAAAYPRHVQWSLFATVPPDELASVLSIARRRTFSRGEVVFHAGDPADSFHLVTRGRFAARLQTRLGDTALLSIVSEGQAFGELALVGQPEPRSTTVSALEASETRAVYGADFARIRSQHPAIDAVLVALLAAQVRRLSHLVLEAYYVDAEARVRRRLVELATTYGGEEPVVPVTVPLTQEDIAGLAGTSRATVNRVLRQEEGRGTIALARGRTVVLDIQALARGRR